MNQCGKLVTMGHGDHAKCGEDYWGKFFQCVECQLKDLKCPDAHPVNVAESSSPMPGLSPKQEPEVSLILQGQSHMIVTLTRLEQIMESLMNVQNQQAAMLSTIIEALAEDQDPDEMPARYLDGRPVL